MTDLPAKRSYSEEEASLILARAAELAGGSSGRGMTLEELEAVGREAGIDGALVKRAATELQVAPRVAPRIDRSIPSAWMGAPTKHVFERAVAGEVDARVFDDVLVEIQRQLGQTGDAERLGRGLAWRSQRGRKITVTLAPRGGRTLVRVEEDTSALANGLMGGLLGGLGPAGVGLVLPIAIAALDLPILIPFGLLAWFLAAYMLSRAVYRSGVAKRRPQLEQLTDAIAEVCSETPFRILPPAPK